MNRKQRRLSRKLGRLPSNPSVKAGTEVVPDLFAAGLKDHQAGRLAEAEACYRQVLADQPDHADALHLLGVVAHQTARHDLAVALFAQAIKQNGQNAAYFCSLGVALNNQGKLDQAVAAYRQAIRIRPELAEAHSNLGNALHGQGKLDEAIAACRQAIRIKPELADAHSNLGNALHGQGKLTEALASYDHALMLRPTYAEALCNRGLTLHELKRFEQALASYDRALALRPDLAEALCNRGLTLHELRRFEEALASYDRALALRPAYAVALSNRGLTLHELKRFEEALASYDRALALRPAYAEALCNRGLTLHELKRFEEALASYDRAFFLRPDYAEALSNRGNTLRELMRLDEALASYDRALTLQPDRADTLNNRGNVLRDLNRPDEALASYDHALMWRPDYAEVLNNRGIALQDLKRLDEALASYDHALTLRPDYAEAHYNRGNVFQELQRLDEALVSYDRLLAVKPNHLHAFSATVDCVMKLCDWGRRARLARDLSAQVKKSIVSPRVLLGCSSDPALQLQCARNFIDNMIRSLPTPFWTGQMWRHDRLRVAYLSPDFRSHATAFLTAELFECHDRGRFEIVGVSFGVDDSSEMRRRLTAAFDEFHDVRGNSDKEVAKLLNDRRVDIAVDLAGYTQDSRPGILVHRPAPIQVSYLGFPATMGANFIDYIIADAIVLPYEHQRYYTEKIAYLPNCYQVNDTKRKIAERTPTRQEMGLPAHAFVFCCFNNPWKITPAIFDVWMRLLHLVEGSVLWLLGTNEGTERNLRKEAQRRGSDPSRLVFAGPLPPAEHLARYRLADLFLDTLPYNAHTTASDALWVGLPVLTVKGEAFAGRVAASLLHAVGIPELITSNLEDYQALALKLARDPALLAEVQAKLVRNRDTCPLFTTERFTRHIETAYMTMWEIWQRGEVPKTFSVETN